LSFSELSIEYNDVISTKVSWIFAQFELCNFISDSYDDLVPYRQRALNTDIEGDDLNKTICFGRGCPRIISRKHDLDSSDTESDGSESSKKLKVKVKKVAAAAKKVSILC
jgi:hypothetical protein